jgi:hypothetical protein
MGGNKRIGKGHTDIFLRHLSPADALSPGDSWSALTTPGMLWHMELQAEIER